MIKNFHCLRLSLRGGFHLGAGMDVYERSYDLWQSDSIKSAIYASLVKLMGDDAPKGEDFLKAFRISSAFPFQGKRLYFPLPRFSVINWKNIEEADRIKFRKKRKKLEWIDQETFEKVLSGVSIKIDQNQLIAGRFLCSEEVPEDQPAPFGDELMERVTLSRVPGKGDNSTPFYFRRIHFQSDSGLFFLVETKQVDLLKTYIFPALRLLGDEGIGSDRSAGGAWFDFNPTTGHEVVTLQLPDSASKWLGLGNFLPTEESWQGVVGEKSNWLWEKRGGYIASPRNPEAINLRKQSVYMLRTGSLLHSAMEPVGRLVDLRPSSLYLPEEKVSAISHPVWRDGAPIFLPMIPADLSLNL